LWNKKGVGMRIYNICLVAVSVMCVQVAHGAREIKVKNTSSKKKRYVALYDRNLVTGNAQRVTRPVKVDKKKTKTVSYDKQPMTKQLTHTRVLLHTKEEKNLREKLSKKDLRNMQATPIRDAKHIDIPATDEKRDARDMVRVGNMTEQPWYIATYVVPHNVTDSAQRYSEVKRVEPGSTVYLPRPDLSFKERIRNHRIIFFHERRDVLAKKLRYQDHRKLPYVEAGVIRGDTFLIAHNPDGATRGYNKFSWGVRPIKKKARQALQKMYDVLGSPIVENVRKKYSTPDVNPWHDKKAQAYTRDPQQVHKQEKQILDQRDTKIRQAVQDLIGRPLAENERTPRIALVCSGGGFRAMFATLGTMRGAGKSGAWDALSYVVGLSGSTWAIAPYMMSNEPTHTFVYNAIQRATQGFSGARKDIRDNRREIHELLTEQMLSRVGFQQILSLIDPYGFMLGRHLLRNTYDNKQPHFMTLADQKDRVKNGSVPYPIYTSVIGQTGTQEDRSAYSWLFYTPYEVGSHEFGAYVPSWGFGRTYNKGASVNNAMPYNLGYCMGIWGSAFSGSLQDIYTMMLSGIDVSIIQKAFKGLSNTQLGNQRLLPARVPNMTYNMQNTPLKDRKYISLIDGGYATNLPIPAVIAPERQADVIIALDVSGDIASSSELGELKTAIDYANRRGVTMPDIDYKKAYNNVASVFTSDNPQAPALVYMPMIKNSKNKKLDPRANIRDNGFLRTANFFYSREDAETFVNLCEQNMKDAMPYIRKAIKHKVQNNDGTT